MNTKLKCYGIRYCQKTPGNENMKDCEKEDHNKNLKFN